MENLQEEKKDTIVHHKVLTRQGVLHAQGAVSVQTVYLLMRTAGEQAHTHRVGDGTTCLASSRHYEQEKQLHLERTGLQCFHGCKINLKK